MNANRCSIFFVDRRNRTVWLKIGTGLEKRQIEIALTTGSRVGQAVSRGNCIIANNLDRQSGYHVTADAKTGYITRNLICAPVMSRIGTGVTAVIEILNKKSKEGFTEDDREELIMVAQLLSMVIDHLSIKNEILHFSKDLNRKLLRLAPASLAGGEIIAGSQSMKDIMDRAQSVSKTRTNVFITGESGTGKEVIARMIHLLSPDRDRPFVKINCSSIPETLMESEFFGHEKGAFSGALTRRKGLLEEADRGTLFLDEIADLSSLIQPKFLGVLQDMEFTRLGSNKVRKLQLRIISATNKDIHREVDEGRFRKDLFYRLFSVEIEMPPLRERVEDIIPLAQSILKTTCIKNNKKTKGFSPQVLGLFEEYDWPGNVRQLFQEVEHLVTLTPERKEITIKDCSQKLTNGIKNNKNSDEVSGKCGKTEEPLHVQVERCERRCIETALKRTGGNKQKASLLLGISRRWLHKKINQHNLR